MKILIILQKWVGGVGIAVKNRQHCFEKKGHIVDIISREDDLKIYSMMRSIFPLRKKIKNLDKKEKYDIIFTCNWSIAVPLIFPYALFKRKHYCGFGGFENKLAKKYIQKIVGFFMGKRLVCYADSLKKEFPKATKIYNGIDLEKFKPLKNIKRISNSVGFANWKTDYYKYKETKSAVEKAGKKFLVAENIPYEKMSDFYNKIETFISLPFYTAGFNMVWIEAMACGVPKVIGNDSGVGSVIPINKVDDFKDIEDAIKNAKGKNYRKWLEKSKFTWERQTQDLIELWGNSINLK